MKVPWRIENVKLAVTKHFALKYMRVWGWNFHELREAIRDAYKMEKIGKEKFDIYIQKTGFKKIVTVYYDENDRLVCITGSEGGGRK